MQELRKLNERINTVLLEYLRKRLGVKPDSLNVENLPQTLINLRDDIYAYQNKDVVSEKPSFSVAYILQVLRYAYNYSSQTLHTWTNTDSKYRLYTLDWLLQSCTEFEKFLNDLAESNNAPEIKSMQAKLTAEIKAFFTHLQDMFETDPKHRFMIANKFEIYGLRGSGSDLVGLIETHICNKFGKQFGCENLISAIDSDISARIIALAEENERLARLNALDLERQQNQQLALQIETMKRQHEEETLRLIEQKKLTHAVLQLTQIELEEAELQAELKQDSPKDIDNSPFDRPTGFVRNTKFYSGYDKLGEVTYCQRHTVLGEIELLDALLKENNSRVNKLCDGPKGCKQSLLELALFTTPEEFRVDTVRLILSYQPNLWEKGFELLPQILAHLQQEKVAPEVKSMLCDYINAHKTCSPDAIEDLNTTYQAILAARDQLEGDQRISEPHPQQAFLFCDLLQNIYNTGDQESIAAVRALNPKGIKPEHQKAIEEIQAFTESTGEKMILFSDLFTGIGRNSLRLNLTTVLTDLFVEVSNLKQAAEKSNEHIYRDLLKNMLGLIDRYGLILDTGKLNIYEEEAIAARNPQQQAPGLF